mmetsp:Transcript_3125/g.19272  ORF Transcript_3125/g.19272 Transcript_3125/m.19272 type:complete len:237 (-) Transcript_3125:896-1606(-)
MIKSVLRPVASKPMCRCIKLLQGGVFAAPSWISCTWYARGSSLGRSQTDVLLITARRASMTLPSFNRTPVAQFLSTSISSTCARRCNLPPRFSIPLTSASAMAWLPPTGNSSWQPGLYHSANIKATSAPRVPFAGNPDKRKQSIFIQFWTNSSPTTPSISSEKGRINFKLSGLNSVPAASPANRLAVATTPRSERRAAGGMATLALANGAMRSCNARHSFFALFGSLLAPSITSKN